MSEEQELAYLQAKYVFNAEIDGMKKADVIRLLREGYNAQEIAIHYRMPIGKIRRALMKWGLNERPPMKLESVYLREKQAGKKDREICSIWDISMRTLYRWKNAWKNQHNIAAVL